VSRSSLGAERLHHSKPAGVGLKLGALFATVVLATRTVAIPPRNGLHGLATTALLRMTSHWLAGRALLQLRWVKGAAPARLVAGVNRTKGARARQVAAGPQLAYGWFEFAQENGPLAILPDRDRR
jgi:hypothetical protein